jgi:NAD-dependent SIR2 family protein deacetylase
MPKKRISIPKAVSETVLKEYRHKCAMCGRHTPQLHHIDEDTTNNTEQNLIPLCPNCHLQDAHDPTRPPDPAKLRLFRKYKDPLILDPRFHPIFIRAQFLYGEALRNREHRFRNRANELLDFVAELSMGTFYRKKNSEPP